MRNNYSRKHKHYLRQIGLNIRNLRKRKGVSQEELAFKAGMDRTYVGSVERGERNISLINIKKIADALEEDIRLIFKRK